MRNEKGLTLLEVLASLSIFLIIIGVIYGVLFSVISNYKNLSSKNNLGQEANLIITTIKSYHQENPQYKLSIDSSANKAYIGEDSASIPLVPDDLSIDLKAGPNSYQAFEGELTIDSEKPLFIYIKLFDKSGQEYELETVINKY